MNRELRFWLSLLFSAGLVCSCAGCQDSKVPVVIEARSGQTESRIQGGHPAKEGRFPYALSIRPPSTNGVSKLHCGAVLIDQSWALSAASCVDRRISRISCPAIYGGSHSIDGPFEEISQSSKVFFPPQWKKNPDPLGGYDIALIKLPCPFHLPTVGLPRPSDKFVEDDLARVIGWGRTSANSRFVDGLQELKLKIRNVSVCKERKQISFASSMVCAGDATGSACHGDSGAPLLLKGDSYDKDTVIGVVPLVLQECGEVNSPMVFTSISAVRGWINATMKENSGKNDEKCESDESAKRIVKALKRGATSQQRAAKLITKVTDGGKVSIVLSAANISIKRGLVEEIARAILQALDSGANEDALLETVVKLLKIMDSD